MEEAAEELFGNPDDVGLEPQKLQEPFAFLQLLCSKPIYYEGEHQGDHLGYR